MQRVVKSNQEHKGGISAGPETEKYSGSQDIETHLFVASLPVVTGHRHQPTRHQETISPPTIAPPRKVYSPPNTNKNESIVCRGELAAQTIFFYLSVHKLRCEHVQSVKPI